VTGQLLIALPGALAALAMGIWSFLEWGADRMLAWSPLLLALLLVLGWYLTYSASRLDRLHHKVESTRAALDAQLVRRAVAAVEVAQLLDPAAGLLLADAATQSLDAGESDDPQRDPLQVPPRLEEVENDLSRALRAVFADPEVTEQLRQEHLAATALDVLTQACTRVQLARRFHNDAVAQAQRVRRKRVVRWARLAGYAPMPQMIEIDDALPPALAA
jgi:hypothetical protein